MFSTRSSEHDDETNRLSVQLSKLNVHAQEFVPAAMCSSSNAGPSGLYCPANFADGSLPYTGSFEEFAPAVQLVPPPVYENNSFPWPEQPISEPGPSFITTDNNASKNNEVEQYTECGYELPQMSTQVHKVPQKPVPEPGTSTAKATLKKRRKTEEKIETEQNKRKVMSTKTKRLCKKKTKKDHVNLVLIGHVDAGKSTIGGQIMSLTGRVDKRTLEKYEKEAREKSRETWYLSWALDINEEEREKGKTVEVGRAYFETEKKHFTILDAPGHKSFVPNMIGGAAQADLAILVISARKGEFETGFERGGQTREHAMLVKTAGVKHLVVVITKMDDPTVNWEESRYNQCKDNILPFLKSLGFNSEKDLSFLPVSGQTGQGLLEKVSEDVCPWYQGAPLITLLDELPSYNRNTDGPFTMPIIDKYKDMGIVLMGKVEAGVTYKGSTLILMPNKVQVTVDQLWCDNIEVSTVNCGENIKVKLKGIDEEDVSLGFVLCDIAEPVTTGKVFDAQLVILETKSIICAGYSAVMHIHCAAEEVTVLALICLVDKKTGDKSKTRPRFVKQGQVAIMRLECAGIVCMEPFKKFGQLGRITLRDENKTIAIGKVLKVVS